MGDERTEVQQVRQTLEAIAARARLLLVTRKVASFLTGVIAVVVALGLLDYLVRLPWGLRLVVWFAGLGLIGHIIWRRIRPAWKLRATPTEIALRLEALPEGATAGLRGLLASGVEFAEGDDAPPLHAGMRAEVASRAAKAFQSVRASALLRPERTLEAIALLVVALLVVTIISLVSPTLTGIGAVRVLTPWADVSWPKRTEVHDATALTVHAIGSAIPLRAELIRTDRPPGQTPVIAKYRIIQDGLAGQTRRMQLVPQARKDDDRHEPYEQLVEPSALAAGLPTTSRIELEYWFETPDDRTSPARIRLVEPPAVASAEAIIEPPPYVEGAISRFASGRLDLGAGLDERAVVGAVLAGSNVTLRLNLNKPITGGDQSNADAIRERIERADPAAVVRVDVEPASWTFSWRLAESVRLPIELIDEHGLGNTEEIVFAFEVMRDAVASASVLDPPEDESVLPGAVIGLIGEGRDDTGLEWVSLTRRVAVPPAGSEGAPPEPVAESVEIARRAATESTTQLTVQHELNLGELNLQPGDEVWITAWAQDTYELDGLRHEPGESIVRTLRVISEATFIEQVRAELAGIRDAARRADDEQRDLIERVQQEGATAVNRARQSALTERAARIRQSVQEQLDRIGRNRLDDRDLQSLLEQAEQLSAGAARASDEAADALDTGREEPDITEEESQAAREAQERVRDELGQLLESLDQGEDAWLAERNLDRLIEQQRALEEQTRAATESTVGRRVEDLAPGERRTLESIAQRQAELAEEARQLIDELQERSEHLREGNPAQAEAMQQAAERGRDRRVPEQLDQAAESVQRNMGQNAQELQRQAREALEQMREDLEQAERNRDAMLRRVLAEIMESIAALIETQEAELARLTDARDRGDFAGLDAPMIQLHRNTLGVADRARRGFAEMRDLASILASAAESQSEAIGELRASVIDPDRAESYENESLEHLRRALEEARRLDEEARQRQIERERQELMRAYREILGLQIGVRDDTLPFVGIEITRKQRALIRRLGDRQTRIRELLRDTVESTESLAESNVVQFAHRRLDDLTARAQEQLLDGNADETVISTQNAVIELLRSILESIDGSDQGQDENQFQEQHGQGQQGQQGQQQDVFPPLAELKLLKSLQEQVYQMTRLLDESGAPPESEVQSLGDLQRELAVEGERLLERVQEQAQTPPAPGGGS